MPLQHVSDRILKRMNRSSTEKSIKDKIAELRRAMPDIAIRTNFIVGFPGETKEDFNRLLGFVKKARLDSVGVFKYSREPGTTAASFPGQVPEEVKEERAGALIQAQSRVLDAMNLELKGKKFDVLMDSPLFGRTYRDAPEIDGRVEVEALPGRPLKAGDLVKVKVTGAVGYLRKAKALP
jgi:ribosomal protein S12 methylthiotransferase